MNIFTCIGRGHGAPALPATRQEWEAMRREPWLAEMCRRIEAGDEKLKRRLPIWTPHCAAFRDNHRAAADALKPLSRLMLDFDEKGHSAEILERSLALQKEGKWQVLLVEESVRRGTHVLIVLPDGMTPQEAQQRFSADVGFQADGALKDVSRCIYMVPEDHTLYVDEERLFGNEELRMKNEELPPANPSVGTHHGASDDASDANDDAANAPHTDDAANAPKADAPWCVPTFKGVPYSEIIQQWFRLAGGEPVQGERNDKLHRLASHLRYIADNDEALLLQVMPRYGLSEEEMRGLIHSACSAKWYSMPWMLKEALNNGELKIENGELPADDEDNNSPLSILNFPLPKRLPALIKLLVSRTPDVYKAAVAHAVFPSLGAHLHRVRFKYIDNVEHEATLMNVLMAGTGAGKDCISEPINRIMADIRRRDEDNLRREREWKNEVTSKGANKDKRQRPEGLIIQEIDADMTNPAFVMRMAEADGHFLYTKLNEIDQFDALRGSGRGGQQFQIMCLAFDPGNRYGQTRVGVQSVTEKVTIRFNWNAATTIQKGKRYFSRVLTDGPISRINFCTIPEREIGAEMPVYGTYDAAFDEELRPYIENLVKAQGLIDCPQAYKLAQKLKEECADFARLSQSRVYENLSFRANVIAYLKACVLFVANGCQWDKTFEDFIRWSLQYDLACKMEFFGADIEEAQAAGGPRNKKGPRNLLELLPDQFTFREVVQTRLREGKNEEGTYKMLRQWIYRGYIQQSTVDSYQKLKFRKDGTDIDKNY
ncbi:VirE protein [Mediterranea massiliensis]|uniref:VirE protein n=1 Tax=Mediterranea massiliensis TaxID=1841865 RepID=UPI00320B15D4